MSKVKVNNPENLPEEIVQAAIQMMEKEENRKLIGISIRSTENPDFYEIVTQFGRINRNTKYLVGYVGPINQVVITPFK